MIEKNEVLAFKIPGVRPLTEQQLGFFLDTMNGMTQKDAYLKNFCEEGVIPENLANLANTTGKAKWYTSYRNYYDKVCAERVSNEMGWTAELSIIERKKLYSLNLLEVERLASAHDKAIAYYTKKKEQAIDDGDEKKMEYYEERIIKEIKSKNMAIASNTACLEALEGLDRVAGLQQVNLNNTTNIAFLGTDMWND